MNNRLGIKHGVSIQLMGAVLISLAAAAAAFFAIYLLGNVVLDRTVYGMSFVRSMSDQQRTKRSRPTTFVPWTSGVGAAVRYICPSTSGTTSSMSHS